MKAYIWDPRKAKHNMKSREPPNAYLLLLFINITFKAITVLEDFLSRIHRSGLVIHP